MSALGPIEISVPEAIAALADARQITRRTGQDTRATQEALIQIINDAALRELIARRGRAPVFQAMENHP